MRESYVPPVTRATEPPSERAAKWRFRLVAIVLLIVVGAATAWGVNKVMSFGNQDPTPIPEETSGP